MWYPKQKFPVWGLVVRHREWATHLAELERLPLGCEADWGHIISTFLPNNGQTSSVGDESEGLDMTSLNLNSSLEAPPRDGVRILVDKLMGLSALVFAVTSAQKK